MRARGGHQHQGSITRSAHLTGSWASKCASPNLTYRCWPGSDQPLQFAATALQLSQLHAQPLRSLRC